MHNPIKKIHIIIFFLSFICYSIFASTGVLWTWQAQNDAVISLETLPDISGDGKPDIAVGLDSGKVVCLDSKIQSPVGTLWSAQLDGTVLALLPFKKKYDDSIQYIAAGTDMGTVYLLIANGEKAGDIAWQFKSTCGVCALAVVPDVNGDGITDIAAGGAEQKIFMRSGADGNPIWSYAINNTSTYSYIHTIVNAGDLNNDSKPDIFCYTWEGKVFGFNGTNGAILFSPTVTSGFTDPICAVGDLTGDNKSEYIVGGNDCNIKLCTGSNGTAVWSYLLKRPVRVLVVIPDLDNDGKPDLAGGTAGGEIVCLKGVGSGNTSLLWSGSIGDVCRDISLLGDINSDGKTDIAVSAENGLVKAFSGADGTELWIASANDVVRCLSFVGDIDGDGSGDLAAGALDGTVALLSGNPKPLSRYWGVLETGTDSKTNFSKETKNDSDIPEYKQKSQNTKAVTEVPILLYHDVAPNMYYYYGVSLANFTEQMDLLSNAGFNCVSLDQILDWIAGKAELPEKPICITFDGPYEGHHTYAYPILKQRGLSATVYCTSDWIGTANHCEWNQLRQMDSDKIIDVQNHTINHANLANITKDKVIEQVWQCTLSIKNHLEGKDALHHAYPSGGYNSNVMTYMNEMGMKSATTVVQRHVVKSDNPMALPRYSVLVNTTISQFRQKIKYTDPTPVFTPTNTATATPTATVTPTITTTPTASPTSTPTPIPTPTVLPTPVNANMFILTNAAEYNKNSAN